MFEGYINKIAIIIVKLTIAGGLLYWLTSTGRIDFKLLSNISFGGLFIVLYIAAIGNLCGQIYRWCTLLHIVGSELSIFETARFFIIAQFFYLVTPGFVGGEIVRGYYVMKHETNSRLISVSTVITDRVLGLFTLTLLGSLSFLYIYIMFNQGVPSIFTSVGSISLVFMLVIGCAFLLLSLQSIRPILLKPLPVRWYESVNWTIERYTKAPLFMLKAFSISLVTNILAVALFIFASRIVNVPLSWGEGFLIVPLLIVANSLPISIGGLGVGEAAAFALFTGFGLENGASVMLLVRCIMWSFSLLGGLIYVIEGYSRPNK